MDTRTDHDLLIRLDTNVQNLTREVAGLRDNTIARMTSLETYKLDKTVFDSYKEENEKAVSALIKTTEAQGQKLDRQSIYIYIGMGIIMTLQFVAMMLK